MKKATKATTGRCMNCPDKVAFTRGVCPACYQAFRKEVSNGTAEATLVAKGFILPAASKGPYPSSGFAKKVSRAARMRKAAR